MATQNWKRQRKIGVLEKIEKRYYIFCEGEKTEPNYFNGIKEKIESTAMYKNSVFVKVQGVGEGTVKILDYAVQFVKDNSLSNSEIWIVYDKDDFKIKDFNSVAQRAGQLNENENGVEYKVAWSNQCIEYWFILHFDYYDSNNDRKYYMSYLNKKFNELKLGKYKKNEKGIFEILEKYGDSSKAIKYAEKRLVELEGLPDDKKAPATKVHLLYRELSRFFEKSKQVGTVN